MEKQIISSVSIDARAYFKGGNVRFRIFSPPYLGVWTGEDASFEEHIEYLVQSSKIRTGMLLRVVVIEGIKDQLIAT